MATSSSAHMTELEYLVIDMKEAECAPSDKDVGATMLRSLSASYESLVHFA